MGTKKLLSISVAIYNMEKYLRECLNSIVSIGEEDLLKCEVILVNDGSTDRSEEIAREYVEKYPQTFLLVSKENGGHGSTINASLGIATGKYYKVLDADDLVNRDGLKRLLKILEKTNVDAISNSYVKTGFDSDKVLETVSSIKNIEYGKEYAVDDVMEDAKNFLQMHSMTFKTELINNRRVVLFEHCYYVDAPYVTKSTALCHSLMVLDFPVYIYRVNRNEQSTSIAAFRKHFGEHEKVMYDMLQYASCQDRLWIKRMAGELVNTQFGLMFRFKMSVKQYRELIAFMKAIEERYPEYIQYINAQRRWLMKFRFLGYLVCVAYARIRFGYQ